MTNPKMVNFKKTNVKTFFLFEFNCKSNALKLIKQQCRFFVFLPFVNCEPQKFQKKPSSGTTNPVPSLI